MKSAVISLLLASASAFAPAAQVRHIVIVESGKDIILSFFRRGCAHPCSFGSILRFKQPAQRAGSVSLNAEEMSKSIPFLVRPEKLDGSMPGDMGFDPMRL